MTRRRHEAGAEETPMRQRRDTGLRRHDVRAEGKPKLHGVISRSDGVRLEWMKSWSCDRAATARGGDGSGWAGADESWRRLTPDYLVDVW